MILDNKELSALYLEKYTLNEACVYQSESLVNLAKLKNHGIAEESILQLNYLLLENNGNKHIKSSG